MEWLGQISLTPLVKTVLGGRLLHDTMYDGRTFRTFNVIDEGNREGLRIECGKSIPSARVVLTCPVSSVQ
ncbi:MAG: hypothetical protein RIS35_164 [Pseudomonadota bacterium]|jgi:hypothetical protein